MEKAFVMLAELLRQEQFELILSDTDIRLVYLMNDAVESFLVFKDAKMTGKYIERLRWHAGSSTQQRKGNLYSDCLAGGSGSDIIF